MSDQVQRAFDVKQKNEKQWMSIEGVVAVGVGMQEGQPGIIISVASNLEGIRRQIPSSIADIKVVVRHTGTIKAQ